MHYEKCLESTWFREMWENDDSTNVEDENSYVTVWSQFNEHGKYSILKNVNWAFPNFENSTETIFSEYASDFMCKLSFCLSLFCYKNIVQQIQFNTRQLLRFNFFCYYFYKFAMICSLASRYQYWKIFTWKLVFEYLPEIKRTLAMRFGLFDKILSILLK